MTIATVCILTGTGSIANYTKNKNKSLLSLKESILSKIFKNFHKNKIYHFNKSQQVLKFQ